MRVNTEDHILYESDILYIMNNIKKKVLTFNMGPFHKRFLLWSLVWKWEVNEISIEFNLLWTYR